MKPAMSNNNIYITLGLALIYALTAQLGFQFSMLPNVSITLFWPPAGIALAAVLLIGWRALPGIMLGALGVSLWGLQAEPGAVMLGAGLAISVATSSSALLAGYALKRISPQAPESLSAPKILLSFFVVAFACTIAASGGVGSLYFCGAIPADMLLVSWGFWWLGEFSSMIIIGPGLWLFIKSLTNSSKAIDPGPMGITLVITGVFGVIALLVFTVVWNFENDRMSNILSRDAVVTAEKLEEVFYTIQRDMEAIRALIYATERVDANEFQLFTSSILQGRKFGPVAQGVGFSPRVTNPETWETEMHLAGQTQVRLHEFNNSGQAIPVAQRGEYFPVQYIQPLTNVNKRAVGFDLGSEESRRGALQGARDSGNVTMVAPIFLVQLDSTKSAVLICVPIYAPGAVLDSVEARLAGFASGVYLVDTLFDRAMSKSDEDINRHLFDEALSVDSQWYATRASSRGAKVEVAGSRPTLVGIKEGLSGIAMVHFSGYTWQVVTTPGPAFIQAHRTWIPWGVALSILLFGITLSSILTERDSARRNVDAERRKTEKALRNAQAANDSKAYFMAAAAHDIKQPLYALSILVETMMMSDLEKSVVPIVKCLGKSIEEMSQHFDSLMDMGRFQDDNFGTHRAKFGLGELAARIDLEIAPLCAEKGLAWKMDMDDVLVFTDEELLLRLFRNLLMNAVSYTTTGEVCCSAKVENSVVEFLVSDTGSGIEEELQSAVFERFVRLKKTEEGATGHGLGLSIVQKISQALDLHLQMVSTPNVGTRFSFRLPAVSPIN
jgi:signal transduction histidine kinase